MQWLFGLLAISLERANQLYTWGWRLSASGAAVTVIGIGLLWWGTRVRDHDFENQMTNLNSEAGAARERAGNLEIRAAGLENDAAQARLEQERLKLLVAWRSLTNDQFDALSEALRRYGGHRVLIIHAGGDSEANLFAIGLERIFTAAGWLAWPQARTHETDLIFGLAIPGSTNPDTAILRAAFRSANIGFGEPVQLPTPFQIVRFALEGVDTPDNLPMIFVGSRPPIRR
jgi:hypothetical protein